MVKLEFLLGLMDENDKVAINLFSSCCEEEAEITGTAGVLRMTLHPFVLDCKVAQIYSEDNHLVLMVDVTPERMKKHEG